MDDKRQVRVSKYLSFHLRHKPEELGLTLEPGGWVKVDGLLAACLAQGFPITRDELAEVVKGSDKQRFAFDESGTRIRANQGHSVAVELQLEAKEPPAVLYHGTAEHTLVLVLDKGLEKMSRHHVHLSRSPDEARKVGRRHGRPVVLTVDAAAMRQAGHEFYCSANGVWLVEAVPPQYLKRI